MLGIHNSQADRARGSKGVGGGSESELLQSVMQLAVFHVTNSGSGPLSRAGMKNTERLDVGPAS